MYDIIGPASTADSIEASPGNDPRHPVFKLLIAPGGYAYLLGI